MSLSWWIAFDVTFLTSMLIVLTRAWHISISADPITGVQKIHHRATPRIGGIATFLGLAAGYRFSIGDTQELLGTMLASSVFAVAVALLEDITKRISVFIRLVATAASACVACVLTGVTMQDTGFLPLDWVLGWPPFAILFTLFAVVGVTNAVNMVDGFNGLASGSVALMSGSIGWIAISLGDQALAGVAFVLSACAGGFLPLNWPWGKVFLGDGGAYLLGFCLAWLAILLPMRSPSVNAWATLLVCAYPVLEVGFSARRRRRRGKKATAPDKGHLHHLVYRRLVSRVIPVQSKFLRINLTAPLCWLMTALPCGWAIVFASNTPMLMLGFALAVLSYSALYARLTQFDWCLSALTLRPKPGGICSS